jgi:hypothetical protein
MPFVPSRVLRLNPIGAAVQYARSFYELVANRRKHERVAISGPVRVTCPGYAVETVYPCSCVDISLGGMAIDCPDVLFPDTIIALQTEERGPKRLARVRYCHECGGVYRIGLEFTAGDDQPN